LNTNPEGFLKKLRQQGNHRGERPLALVQTYVCFGSFSTGAAGFAHGSMSAFPQKHLLTGRQRNDAKGQCTKSLRSSPLREGKSREAGRG
jgi:hypothetical protein